MKSKYERTLGRKDIEVLHNGAEQACSEIASPPLSHLVSKTHSYYALSAVFFLTFTAIASKTFSKRSLKFGRSIPWIEFHLYGQRQPADFLEDLIRMDGFTHHGIVMPLEKKFEIMEKAHCFVIPLPSRRRNTGTIATPFPPNCLNSLPPVARSYLTVPRKLRQIEYLRPTTWASHP